MNHTEGKLKADGSFIKNRNGEMVAGTTMIAATEGSQSSHEANARRLVACWNACEGIPTEWLESVSQEITVRLFGETIQQRDELERENAALRAAIPDGDDRVYAKDEHLRKAAEEMLIVLDDPNPTGMKLLNSRDALRAALGEK